MSPLQADVFRATGRTGWAATLALFLKDAGFRPVLTLRLHQRCSSGFPGRLLAPFIALAHRFLEGWAGMQLPLSTVVGPGLAIAHCFGVVVNGKAVLGSNVTLFHGATIGQGDEIGADGERRTFYPVIADDVWIGPHAVIAGDVRVGSGSRIMAGAVVVNDVPPRSMVAGNPSRVVREDCLPDVFNRVPIGP
ncbi:serine acetyltransferase [Altererythrobacter sp. B11]|uniref:serine O-acetyltransferase n=1 Tax=Altererythrobacter sp. B11 TaxID=2060312 RepID=UPI000DC71921|nr:serine acetyltransferase [Altererythrobacter sp. B11]BBC70962.1 serine acetyltransferase [Altererythrobacter sp. B11]